MGVMDLPHFLHALGGTLQCCRRALDEWMKQLDVRRPSDEILVVEDAQPLQWRPVLASGHPADGGLAAEHVRALVHRRLTACGAGHGHVFGLEVRSQGRAEHRYYRRAGAGAAVDIDMQQPSKCVPCAAAYFDILALCIHPSWRRFEQGPVNMCKVRQLGRTRRRVS